MLKDRATHLVWVFAALLFALAQVDVPALRAATAASALPAARQSPPSAPDTAADVLERLSETKQVIAGDATAGDEFGYAVAVSADTMVVGAHNDDATAGSAYVFERDLGGPGNWGQRAKLTASDAAAGDYFGAAVAISGDTVVVGAWGNDGCLVTPCSEQRGGTAYIFERNQGGANNWGEVKRLAASDAMNGDRFGCSVDIEGDTIAVGAEADAPVMFDGPGAAYLFERNRGGAGNWGEAAKVFAESGVWGGFGNRVAISGNTLVVSARICSEPLCHYERAGAFVFERDPGGVDNWGLVKKLYGTYGRPSIIPVAVSGDLILLRSGYMFERNHGGIDNWGEVAKLTASEATSDYAFGWSALAVSGSTAVVGAYGYALAFVFERDLGGPNNWGEAAKLIASNHASGDSFGWSLALSGETLAVGDPAKDAAGGDSGAAFVFEPPAAPTLSSPSGAVGDKTPTYEWEAVANSSWYYLWVEADGVIVYREWHRASDVCGASTCSMPPDTSLDYGDHTWWVQSRNALGVSPWSAELDFEVSAAAPPPPATLVGPESSVLKWMAPFTFSWNEEPVATWYLLWLDGPSGNLITQWYTTATASCSGGTCSVTPPVAWEGGSHRWWVRTWSSGGYGPWSTAMSFEVDDAPPVPPSLLLPEGNITDATPTYSWTEEADATWYYLWVEDQTIGDVPVVQVWYSVAGNANCDGSYCSVMPPTVLTPGHSYQWWVQSWSPNGAGPWSSPKVFTVQ